MVDFKIRVRFNGWRVASYLAFAGYSIATLSLPDSSDLTASAIVRALAWILLGGLCYAAVYRAAEESA